MATIRTTPQSLEFSYTSVWVPVCCAAMGLIFSTVAFRAGGLKGMAFLACALFCLLIAGVFMEKTQAQINLSDRTVSVSRKNLRKAYDTVFPLDELQAVCLEQTSGQKTTCYRVTLVSSKGSIPLTGAFTGGNGPMEDAERIYVWLTEHGVDVESTSSHYRP